MEPESLPFSAVKEQWAIHYSRFFNFPDLPSTCLTLSRLPSWKLRSIGNWVSSSSLASLQLITDPSALRTVLVVSFQGKIYEEHYASKLRFTWPQVSCLAECPIRGSKVVFASYRDCAGQLQKFAMRFATSQDSQTFMNFLKENMKDAGNASLASSNCGIPTSLPLELVNLNGINAGPGAEFCHEIPTGNHDTLLQSPSNDKGLIYHYAKEPVFTRPEVEDARFPSSFTSLLSNSCLETEQGMNAVELPESPATMNIMSQMVRGMTSSSFQDMLSKLEMVIDDLGGDLAL